MLRLACRRARVWNRAGFSASEVYQNITGYGVGKSSSISLPRLYSVEPAVQPSHEELPPRVKLLIGGSFLDSKAEEWIDVINPATQDIVSKVPLTTAQEFETAVEAAKQAYPKWRDTPVTVRQRIMLKLQELIRRDMDKLAQNVTMEQGKTLADARGDVFRGLGLFLPSIYSVTLTSFVMFTK
ncbi:hypothetical protein L7F22_051405 [Adiantum nelumboides]|nr:hypothetical protein [Adiantum nelumboides]